MTVTSARRGAGPTIEPLGEPRGEPLGEPPGEPPGEPTAPTEPTVPTPALGGTERAALARKYRLLLQWRLARDAAAAGGTPAQCPAGWADGAPATRTAMRALAEEFPGCLRELDRLGAPELARRAALLAEDGAKDTDAENWIDWIWTYHRLVAAALVARRQDAPPTPQDDGPPPPFLAAFVQATRAPAGGRLSQVAIAFVARHAGATPADVAATLFPSRSR